MHVFVTKMFFKGTFDCIVLHFILWPCNLKNKIDAAEPFFNLTDENPRNLRSKRKVEGYRVLFIARNSVHFE